MPFGARIFWKCLNPEINNETAKGYSWVTTYSGRVIHGLPWVKSCSGRVIKYSGRVIKSCW
eukprot:3108843-Pyramimonas_sp.AAC.1